MRLKLSIISLLGILGMIIVGCSREQRAIDNKFKEAIKLYKRGKVYDALRNLKSIEELLPSLEPDKKLSLEYRLANTYYQFGYLDDAYTHYKGYVYLLKKLPIKDTQQAIIRLVEVAEAFTELGKFTEAHQVLIDAQNLWEKLSPAHKDEAKDSLAFFQLLEGFAFYYLKTFNYPKADSLYSFLLSSYGELLSYDNSKRYITFLLRSADAFLRVGKPSLADSVINIALKELENKISKNALDEAEVLNMLAQIYENKGELQKTIQTAQKAMEIYSRHFGWEHPLYISAHFNYASALQVFKDIDTAIVEAKRGLILSKKVFGDTSIYTSRYYNLLGMLYVDKAIFESSYYDSAIIAMQNAIDRIIPITGEESFPVAVLYNNISNAYTDINKKLETRKKSLEISQKILPTYHQFNLLAMANLAQTAAIANLNHLADSLYTTVFEHSEKLSPVYLFQFKFNYGIYKYYEQEFDLTIKVLSEVVETYETDKDFHNFRPVYSAALAYLGLAYLQQNMPEIAKTYLIKADSIFSAMHDKVEYTQFQNLYKNVKAALKYIEENS